MNMAESIETKRNFQLWKCVLYLMLTVTGCNPGEGGFRPDRQVEAIYEEAVIIEDGDTLSTQPRVLAERWNWDGRELKSIDYYNGSALEVSEVMRYEDRRIVSAGLSGGFTEVYHYGGDKLDSITVYDAGGRWVESVCFQHSKVRVKRVSWNSPAGVKTYKLSWQGENPGSLLPEDGAEDTIEFSYDNRENPVLGLMTWWRLRDVQGLAEAVSRNNCIKIRGGGLQADYSYEYDGDYPVSRTVVREYDYTEYVWDPVARCNRERVRHRYEKQVRTIAYL